MGDTTGLGSERYDCDEEQSNMVLNYVYLLPFRTIVLLCSKSTLSTRW